jgi:uncharacterized membrane protein (DUF106 family)
MVLHFYFQYKSIPIPVYAVVYGSLIIGALIGMIVGINARFTQRKKIRQLQKENRDLKDKVVKPAEDEKTAEETAIVEKDASSDEAQDASPDETQTIQSESEDEEEEK